MPGRLQVPDAAPLLDSWEKRNSWRCRGCLSVRGTARFLCAGAAGGRHRCRCSVRGCRPSPLAAVVAVVVVAGSWWLVPCVTYRLPRSFVGRFRRQRRVLLLVPARPGGLGKFLRRASPSFLGRARVGCLPWLARGVAVFHHLLFPALPLNSPAHRSRTSPGNTGNEPPAASPKKEKHPGNPVQTRCRCCRAAPGVAGGCRGGPSGRPCQQARTAVPPHCLCRLSPCPVGFVQNPFVYRAKLNTQRVFAIYWRQGCIFNWPRSSSTIVYGICGEAVWMILFTQSACGNPHADRAFSSRSTSYSTRRIVGTESSCRVRC